MSRSLGVGRRCFAAAVSLAVVVGGVMTSSRPVHADLPTFHMLDNGKLRFGGNSNSNCWDGCVDVSTPEDSISSIGLVKQPFYFSNVDNQWHKLTYGTYPLNLAIGTGTNGPNWSTSTVLGFNPNPNSSDLSGMTVDHSEFTTLADVGTGVRGYGALTSTGTSIINGQAFAVTERIELGETDSFVKITTTLQNTSGTDAANVNLWVGTQDDWVGSSDTPTKVKGNLVNGDFVATTDVTESASALEIVSGTEGMLFYSTTPGTNVAINGCCSFSNAYNTNPTESPLTITNDGSYAMHLPVGTLADGASTQIVWYYGAGAGAELPSIVDAIATAASPPPPLTAVAGNHQATVSWLAPDSESPITDYSIRHRIAGSSDPWDELRIGSVVEPLTTAIAGLTNGITYEFQVAGVTGTLPAEVIGEYSVSTEVVPGAPVNSGLPVIVGTPLVGLILTAVDPDSNWTSTDGSPMIATYQWQANGIDIPGTNSVDFAVMAAQAGTTMRVVVTRTNTSGAVMARSGPVSIPAVHVQTLAISPGQLSPAFAPEHREYTAIVEPDVLSVSLIPTADVGASITVNGAWLFDTSALVELEYGPNVATVVVTQWGHSITYTVEITRLPLPALALTALAVSHGTLGPAFSPGHTSYAVSVDSTVSSVLLSPVAPAGVTVTVNGVTVVDASAEVELAFGANTFSVVVERGSETITYTVVVTRAITPVITPAPPVSPVSPQPLAAFNPISPFRIADTRTASTPIDDGEVLEIDVVGSGVVPGDSTAVVLDVVVTAGRAPGYLTVYPCGTLRPPTSNLNYVAGQTVANSVTSAIGTNGKVCIYVQSRADVVVDINGFLRIGAGYRYLPLAPVRLTDTREGAAVQGGSVLEVAVTGRGGVPADAIAVVLNVAATQPEGAGFLTVYPCAGTAPTASNLNYDAGQTMANSVTTPIAADGMVCIFAQTTTHIVVDVNGVYAPSGTSLQQMLTPQRLRDTRESAKVEGGQVFEIMVADQAGVPANATAAMLNVTVTEADADGYLTVFPCDITPPTASNVNYTSNRTIANAVVAMIGTDGKVCIYLQSTANVVVDLGGYLIPAA